MELSGGVTLRSPHMELSGGVWYLLLRWWGCRSLQCWCHGECSGKQSHQAKRACPLGMGELSGCEGWYHSVGVSWLPRHSVEVSEPVATQLE